MPTQFRKETKHIVSEHDFKSLTAAVLGMISREILLTRYYLQGY